MTQNRPQFSGFTRYQTWACFATFAFLPLAAIMTGNEETPMTITALVKSLIWATIIIALFIYARYRCSSAKLIYEDGMYYVDLAMRVWGTGASFLLTLPTLFVVFLASVIIAVINDVRGKKTLSPAHFYKLISLVYKNRLYPQT